MNWKHVLPPAGLLLVLIVIIRGCLAWHYADMAHVEKGRFEMGCAECQENEKPVHTVELQGFWIDRYEVTFSRYVEFLNQNRESGLVEVVEEQLSDGSKDYLVQVNGSPAVYLYPKFNSQILYADGVFSVREGNADLPATVTWYGAQAYCQTRMKRLPTEAEWEYAAKGGHLSRYVPGQVAYFRYSGSDDADLVAWHRNNSGSASHPVGQKQANEVGTFDMSGNAREWVNDWYGEYPSSNGTQVDPQGPASGPGKVMRGGAWLENTYPDYVDMDLEMQIDSKRVRVTKRDYG